MADHKVRIRLRGVNPFDEVFPAGSVSDAKALARVRYPEALKISWIGQAAPERKATVYTYPKDTTPAGNGYRGGGYSPASTNTGSTYRPSSSSSSSYSGGGGTLGGALIGGLIGFGFSATWWTAKTTAQLAWWTAADVVYPTLKWTTTNVVVPASIWSAKTTYSGLKYVATVTAPQVWSFTANTIAPAVVSVVSDIITWVREMVASIFAPKSSYPSVQAQYRVETI